LVVEDENRLRDYLCQWFAEEGFVVTGVECAETAEAAIAQDSFAAIALDLRLSSQRRAGFPAPVTGRRKLNASADLDRAGSR
jgi:DNA-binding response OmpR family regulator